MTRQSDPTGWPDNRRRIGRRLLWVVILAVLLPSTDAATAGDEGGKAGPNDSAPLVPPPPPALGPTSAPAGPTMAAPIHGPPQLVRSYRSVGNLTSGAISRGKLWAGTMGGGLVRWDLATERYELFTPPGRVERRMVTSIAAAPDGTVWFGTRGAGLGRFDGSVWRFYGPKQGLPSELVQGVTVEADGTVWIATSRGAARLKGKKLRAYGRAQGLPGTDLRSVGLDSSGRVWFGTFLAGPGMMRKGRFVSYGSTKGFPAVGVNCIVRGRGSSLWFCTDQGAVRLDGDRMRRFSVEHGLVSPRVRAIGQTGGGTVWFGTPDRGLSRLAGREWRNPSRTEGAPGSGISFIIPTGRKVVYVGTQTAGVWRYDGRTWRQLERGIAGNDVRAFGFDSLGNVWIGTNTGVSRLSGGRWTNWTGLPLPSVRVTGIAADPGTVWISTMGGAAVSFDGSRWRSHEVLDGVVSHELVSATTTPGAVWFVSATAGVSRFSQGRWVSFKHKGKKDAYPPPNILVRAIQADSLTRVWLATHGAGVLLFDGRKWTRFAHNSKLPHKVVNDLALDAYRRVWFATRGGLAMWDGTTMKVYGKKDGLPDLRVTSIASEGDTIWVGTRRGVACLRQGRWALLGRDQGIPTGVISAVRVGIWGDKWFGTKGAGATVYRGTCRPSHRWGRRRRR